MGFLIDAVATWFGFWGLPQGRHQGLSDDRTQQDYLAEFNNRMIEGNFRVVVGGVDSQA